MEFTTKIKVRHERKCIERKYGIQISDDYAKEVLDYCINKLKYIGKDENYLPLLYRCELPIHIEIDVINNYGRERMEVNKNVRYMRTHSLQPWMS